MHPHSAIPQADARLQPGPATGGARRPAAPALTLDWMGTYGKTSCRLDEVWRDPSLVRGIAGVYLIWFSHGADATVLYVGNGRDIGALLNAQHDDPRITAHAWAGDLTVSWAAVASVYRPGVTRYLISAVSPVIAEPQPVAREVPVNLPL